MADREQVCLHHSGLVERVAGVEVDVSEIKGSIDKTNKRLDGIGWGIAAVFGAQLLQIYLTRGGV